MVKSGDRVSHPLFGAGTVRTVSGSGEQMRVTVEFSSSVGQKTLLAKLAKLTPLGGAGENQSASPRDAMPAPSSFWYENAGAAFTPKRGIRIGAGIEAELRAELQRHDFWTL